MTSKGEDDGCSEKKEEKQVISLGRKRGDDTAGVAVSPPPAPREQSRPCGDQRNGGGSPDPGRRGRAGTEGRPSSFGAGGPAGKRALGSGGRVGATSRACPPSSPPRSQTASARGTGLSAWVTSAMRGPQLAGRATGKHRNRGLDRRLWANATALQGPGDNTPVRSDGPLLRPLRTGDPAPTSELPFRPCRHQRRDGATPGHTRLRPA